VFLDLIGEDVFRYSKTFDGLWRAISGEVINTSFGYELCVEVRCLDFCLLIFSFSAFRFYLSSILYYCLSRFFTRSSLFFALSIWSLNICDFLSYFLVK